MTITTAQELLCSLAPDCPYFRSRSNSEVSPWPPSLPERLGMGLYDPALLFNLAYDFSSRSLALPEVLLHTPARRAYEFLTGSNRADRNFKFVYDLQSPAQRLSRDVFRALLLTDDGSDARIAEVFHCEPEAVCLGEQLFFNVRDRKHELLYLVQLLRRGPATDRPRAPSDLSPSGCTLLRLAYLTRSSQVVLQAAGFERPPRSGTRSMRQRREIKTALLAEASTWMQIGCFDKLQNPALAQVERYLLNRLEPAQAPVSSLDALFAISQNPECQKTIQQMLAQQMTEKLKAQHQELEEALRKERASQPVDHVPTAL